MSESDFLIEAEPGESAGAPMLDLPATPETIEGLIAGLTSRNGSERQHAREALVAIGYPVVERLMHLVLDPRPYVRWEATKTLADIGDPIAAQALVAALEDSNFGTRWLAAEGLVAFGRPALRPLIHALMERSGSVWLRQGAHHVLRSLVRKGDGQGLMPVLNALEGMQPAETLPGAAFDVLQSLPQ